MTIPKHLLFPLPNFLFTLTFSATMSPPPSNRRSFLTHMTAGAFLSAAPRPLRATSQPEPHAHPQALGLDPARLERAYALVTRMLSPRPEYGAAILIGRHDRTLAPRAFGRMGAPGAPPVRTDTIFLIASCTKPIVAGAACLLIERGLLELDQPLHEIIPEVAKEQHGIRLLHLMTHTSGFGSIPRNQEFRANRQPLDRFLREMFKRKKFDFAPGTGVKYCNAGFLLLSEAISRTSGMSTPDFLEKEFFRPLGMPDSFLGRTDEDRRRISDCVLPPDLAAAVSNWNTATSPIATGSWESSPTPSLPPWWNNGQDFPAATALPCLAAAVVGAPLVGALFLPELRPAPSGGNARQFPRCRFKSCE